ncbi:pre-rRNA processing protein, partial [Coemansia sp. RSA 678]
AGKKSFGSAFEDIIYGSESEFEDSEDEQQGSTRKKNDRVKKSKGGQQVESSNAMRAGAWIKEDTDGPLDFLDRSAFTHFSTIDPAMAATAKARRARSEPKVRNGKFVFDDEEEDERKAKAAAEATQDGTSAPDASEDYYLQSLTSKEGFYRTANQKIKFHKRKAGDSDEEMGIASDNEGGVPKPSMAKKGKGNAGTVYGREFRSKKAQGDVKRGNVDPYAYVPLNPKTMKKDE